MLTSLPTLTHWLLQEQRDHGGSGALTQLLDDVVTACKMVAQEISQGALLGNLGTAGAQNVQGEEQKTLDVIANDIFLAMNSQAGHYGAMASEELEDVHVVRGAEGRYLLLFDPLDGSSNIDVDVSVGSIFSILRLPEGASPTDKDVFLQKGVTQVAAGYALYGPSTMLVLTMGNGVHGFTLDRGTGLFYLTHPKMTIPTDTKEFAINASRARFWEPPVRRYVEECQAGKEGPRGKDFNMRWIASMVAEVHRILVRGGVFMYPSDSQNIKQGGKLRLMYEANPMSFLVEQAGGAATTGRQRILDIAPSHLHQRVPVILGAKTEAELLVKYHAEFDAG